MIGMDDQEILAALDFATVIRCDSEKVESSPAGVGVIELHGVASWFVAMHECKPPGATVPDPNRVGDVALCAKCAGDIAGAFTTAEKDREKYQIPMSADFGVTCGICDRKFKWLSEYMEVTGPVVQPGSGHE